MTTIAKASPDLLVGQVAVSRQPIAITKIWKDASRSREDSAWPWLCLVWVWEQQAMEVSHGN